MLKRIGLNFAAQLVALGLSFVDRFLIVGIIIRSWGPDTYADWLLLGSVAGLIALTELGAGIYFGNVWQKATALGDQRLFQRMVSLALSAAVLLGVVISLVVAVCLAASPVIAKLGLNATPPSTGTAVLVLLSAVAISRVMRGCLSQIYRGVGSYATGTMIDQAATAANVVATIAVVVAGGGVLTLAIALVITDALFGWLLTLWKLRARFSYLAFRPALPTRAEAADFVAKIQWYAVLQGVPVAWLALPVVIMNQSGLAARDIVGFTLARTLVNMARQIGTMLSLSAGVELAGLFQAGSADRVANATRRLGTLLAAVSAVAGVGIIAFGMAFAQVWTGHGELLDLLVAGWLIVALLAISPAVIISALQMLANQPRPPALAQLVQLGLGLGAMWALSRPFGIQGAAAGLAIGEAVGLGIVLPLLSARDIGLDYSLYVAGCAAAAVKAASLAGAAAAVLVWLAAPHGGAALVFVGGGWLLLGAAPALFAALPQDERARVLARVRLIASSLRESRAG